MTAPAEPFWHGLVDDAATFPPGDAELQAATEAHLEREHPLVRSFVVRDTDLPRLQVPDGRELAVSVVVTGGAGQVAGPARFCARPGLRLASLAVALRDLDDLAGNARRVVAAVDAARADGVLPDDVPVHVELPQDEPSASWLRAADEVAAAELRLKLRTGGLEARAFPTAPVLAAWVDAALDRETPFTCTAGLHRALRHTGDDGFEHHGFLNVLAATLAAFDGASREDVVALVDHRHPDLPPPEELARARRWFTSFGSCSVDEPLADLRTLGLAA